MHECQIAFAELKIQAPLRLKKQLTSCEDKQAKISKHTRSSGESFLASDNSSRQGFSQFAPKVCKNLLSKRKLRQNDAINKYGASHLRSETGSDAVDLAIANCLSADQSKSTRLRLRDNKRASKLQNLVYRLSMKSKTE